MSLQFFPVHHIQKETRKEDVREDEGEKEEGRMAF